MITGGRPLFYDRQGRPLGTEAWAILSRFMSYKVVGQTVIGDGDWWVSTVWLGMDMSFMEDGPVIFETMIFYRGDAELDTLHPELRDLDTAQWRWRTEAEADAGHDDACIGLRRMIANVAMADEVMREAVEATTQWRKPDA